MFLKLFRKPPDERPRPEQDSLLADAHARRVSAIAFQPSKGFLKDRPVLKRAAAAQPGWTRK
jgi:hypothetical protein